MEKGQNYPGTFCRGAHIPSAESWAVIWPRCNQKAHLCPYFKFQLTELLEKIRMQTFLPCDNVNFFFKTIALLTEGKSVPWWIMQGQFWLFSVPFILLFFLTNPCCHTTMALPGKYQGNSPGIDHLGASAKMLSFIYYVIWHLSLFSFSCVLLPQSKHFSSVEPWKLYAY